MRNREEKGAATVARVRMALSLMMLTDALDGETCVARSSPTGSLFYLYILNFWFFVVAICADHVLYAH